MPRSRPTQMSEVEILNGFIEEGSVLLDHPLWSSGYTPKFSVRMSVNEPIEFGDHEPTREVFDSFLLRIRPLMAKGEPYFIDREKNLVKRYTDDQEIHDLIIEQEESWKYH